MNLAESQIPGGTIMSKVTGSQNSFPDWGNDHKLKFCIPIIH